MFDRIKAFVRNTFLAGIFAAIPLVATLVVLWYVDKWTREPLKAVMGLDIPFLGFGVAVVLIFVLGILVRSLLGRFLLNALDRLILRVPVLADLYKAWKQISLTPGGSEGVYSRVVLVQLDGDAWHIAFTTGDGLEGDPGTLCVFVPTAPNPLAGRLLFVPRARVRPTDLTVEDVFKFILSSGNYVPAAVGQATSTP